MSGLPSFYAALSGLRRKVDSGRELRDCPARWVGEFGDEVNNMRNYIDPIDPARIDLIAKKRDALRELLVGKPWTFASVWQQTVVPFAVASVPIVALYVLLYWVFVRSLTTGLTNILEALAIERAAEPATTVPPDAMETVKRDDP